MPIRLPLFLTAVALGTACDRGGPRTGDEFPNALGATPARLDSIRDSANAPIMARLRADAPYRAPVRHDGPLLVLFAPRRLGPDTVLQPVALTVLALADSVAGTADSVGIAVEVRETGSLQLELPGRLVTLPRLNVADAGFLLVAPARPVLVDTVLPTAAALRLRLRDWAAEAPSPGPGKQQATGNPP